MYVYNKVPYMPKHVPLYLSTGYGYYIHTKDSHCHKCIHASKLLAGRRGLMETKEKKEERKNTLKEISGKNIFQRCL